MMSVARMMFIAGLLFAAPVRAAGSDDSGKTKAVTPDPNERVCQDIVLTGSRLAKSRFCGTRAEWEARQKQDRDVIEDAQRHAADPCHAILTHTGPPNCG
jgi:hypothetical protein